MKMKINLLSQGEYGFTIEGKDAVKKLMMDKETSQIDLLVRESVQNCLDATKKDADNCIVKFDLKEFSGLKFSECIENYSYVFKNKFGMGTQSALVISDLNTTGLLGKPYRSEGDNNLYKLVYAFLKGKTNEHSGGSWGIGKTVYFRYGCGLVLYYSRTFEDGKYISKLAGTILEDQTKSERIIKDPGYCGVAFIGDEGMGRREMRSVPIYDENRIKEVLDIFGLKAYSGSQTGTSVIIPYFDSEKCLHDRRNTNPASWENDFVFSLKIAVQRWYFAKLSNHKEKKYLDVYVNGEKIELIPFFKTLQNLYNNDIDEALKIKVIANNFDVGNDTLGVFQYKLFTNEELGVLCRPDLYPDPYVLLDIDTNNNEYNNPILFYMRKPRMVVTYEDSDLNPGLKTEKGQYIIGCFVLNDEASKGNDSAGKYFKGSENANHKKWTDYKDFEICPEICSLKSKPFNTIKKQINAELNNHFGTKVLSEEKTINSKLQNELTERFLPKEGYGKHKGPSVVRKKQKKADLPSLPKPKKVRENSIYNLGFIDGMRTNVIHLYIPAFSKRKIQLLVSTTAKNYILDDWINSGMNVPFYIEEARIDSYVRNYLNQTEIKINGCCLNNSSSSFKKRITDTNGESIIKFYGECIKDTNLLGAVEIRNCIENDIYCNVEIKIRAKDPTTKVDIDIVDEHYAGGNNNE